MLLTVIAIREDVIEERRFVVVVVVVFTAPAVVPRKLAHCPVRVHVHRKRGRPVAVDRAFLLAAPLAWPVHHADRVVSSPSPFLV
jgi:hypothetical protein